MVDNWGISDAEKKHLTNMEDSQTRPIRAKRQQAENKSSRILLRKGTDQTLSQNSSTFMESLKFYLAFETQSQPYSSMGSL
jgi:hypothetical protein